MLSRRPLIRDVELVDSDLLTDRVVCAVFRSSDGLGGLVYRNSFLSTDDLGELLGKESCVLRELCIGRCLLDGSHLMHSLANNASVLTLQLNGCDFTNGLIDGLALVLNCNTSLRDVDIGNNCLNLSSAANLASSLASGASVRRLNVEMSDFGQGGVVLLVDALAKNKVLDELEIGCVDLTDDVLRSLYREVVYDRVNITHNSDSIICAHSQHSTARWIAITVLLTIELVWTYSYS
uniref:Uncharacterized protein n=1 Tax=Ixodes ricinus TaxID=34613 RepID=A0A0K8R9I6_IXORI